MKNKNIIIFIILTLIVIVQGLGKTLSISAESDREKRRVVLIGIDAAGWDFIEPLLKKGKLPNLHFLLQNASSGKLSTVRGGAPMQWTTLATGQTYQKHGIIKYLHYPPGLNSEMRKCKAIWNILSENNIKVGIVGWLATWPAEKVNGYLVSNYTKYRSEPPDDMNTTKEKKLQLTYTGTMYVDKRNKLRQTYPREFYYKIEPKIKEKERIGDGEIFLQFRDLQKNRQKFYDIKWNYIANEIFADIGLALLNKPEVNFISFIMYGIDVAFHRAKAETPNLQEDYYNYIDKRLGDCLSYLDRNTTFIIVSEHGLAPGKNHAFEPIDGIIIVKGPHIKKNYSINSASILDIVPTILYLFNIGIPRDMEGKVLINVFEDEYTRKYSPKIINSSVEIKKQDSFTSLTNFPFDDAIYERIVKIGYFRK